MHIIIKGGQAELVESDKLLTVKGDIHIDCKGGIQMQGGTSILMTAGNSCLTESSYFYVKSSSGAKIEDAAGIELKSGGSSIVIGPGGIWIDGPMIYIKSGSGAPVSLPTPTTGSLQSPNAAESPELPRNADTAQPGERPVMPSAQSASLRAAAQTGAGGCAV